MNITTKYIPFPKGKCNVILADPSWDYKDKASAGGRGSSYKFPTMDLVEIALMPVEEIASKNCILFLWATPPMINEAMVVLKSWGFKYKTFGFVWVKKTRKGTKKIGMGHYTRSNAEVCLIGVKGKPKIKSHSVRQVIESIAGENSAKPVEVHERIEQLMGDKTKKIELFARSRKKGWKAWGLEVDRRVINHARKRVKKKKQ
jgi:site-specific DNA-methyltransferase (adenine-specific)